MYASLLTARLYVPHYKFCIHRFLAHAYKKPSAGSGLPRVVLNPRLRACNLRSSVG